MVVDGNMKLVHLRNQRLDDDVPLSDGKLFNVKHAPYAQHLASAPDRQPVFGFWTLFNCFILKKDIEIQMQ